MQPACRIKWYDDSIRQQYQTEKWAKPARVQVEKISEDNGIVTVSAQLLDEKNVPCLDAADWVSFGLAGEGSLIDDQGTATGSRHVQACNGRVRIRVRTRPGASVISVKAGNLSTVFLNL